MISSIVKALPEGREFTREMYVEENNINLVFKLPYCSNTSNFSGPVEMMRNESSVI
jgi:hypothetical protein